LTCWYPRNAINFGAYLGIRTLGAHTAGDPRLQRPWLWRADLTSVAREGPDIEEPRQAVAVGQGFHTLGGLEPLAYMTADGIDPWLSV